MKDSPTQIEYLIDNNILKQPNEVGSDMNPKTEWYDTLSKTEQDIYFLKITEQWWDEYGQHIFNDVYTDVLVNDKVSGNILSEFNQYIKSEMDGFEKYIGLSEYNDNLMRSYLVELGIDVDDADKEDIVHQLQKRRQNGGCSLWRNWGIKWMVDNGFYDELLDWEKEMVG